jgi:hypothetical protein
VVHEAVEQGFTVNELFRDVGRNVEVAGAEEVEEDGEAIGVPVDEEDFVLAFVL